MNWWRKHAYHPPERDVFKVLKWEAAFRYESPRPVGEGHVCQGDVRTADALFPNHHGRVALVITSPPYPDTTHFAEDQWLRGWFLGGKPRPSDMRRADDRHYSLETYWRFLTEAWTGAARLLSDRELHVVIRIGGSKLDLESARDGLQRSLNAGLSRQVLVKSAAVSEIIGGQLKSFRPKAGGTSREFDFVFTVGKLARATAG